MSKPDDVAKAEKEKSIAKACELTFVQPQEVIFTGPFSDWIFTYVTLINPSRKARTVFKFKSNCKRNFTVRPVFGFVEKGSATAIKVTCRPLKPDWLASRHRLTVVIASEPTHPMTPKTAEEIWEANKPWTPHADVCKTVIVKVKYRRDDGSEIGGSAGEGLTADGEPITPSDGPQPPSDKPTDTGFSDKPIDLTTDTKPTGGSDPAAKPAFDVYAMPGAAPKHKCVVTTVGQKPDEKVAAAMPEMARSVYMGAVGGRTSTQPEDTPKVPAGWTK